MTHVSFTRAAQSELLDAQVWYEAKKPGLGRRFRSGMDEDVKRIASNPRQFPMLRKQSRRAVLDRFPYAVIFTINEDESVTVLACIHGSRDPVRWQERV